LALIALALIALALIALALIALALIVLLPVTVGIYHPIKMFGVLIIAFTGNSIACRLGVSRKRQIFI
jgi:hypothetical protein